MLRACPHFQSNVVDYIKLRGALWCDLRMGSENRMKWFLGIEVPHFLGMSQTLPKYEL